MKYELAKQLKDSKFPQIHSGDSRWITKIGDFVAFYRIDDNGNYRGINTSKDAVENNLCYYPTLSELIEACGKMSLFSYEGQKVWQAEGGKLTVNKETMQGGYEVRVVGNTPEEAVASLWLKIPPRDNIK